MTLIKKLSEGNVPADLNKVARNLIIAEIVGLLILTALILWTGKKDPPAVINPEILRELQQAEQNLREAKEDSLLEVAKYFDAIQKRDSINNAALTAEIHINRSEIKKSKDATNKKISAIGAYTSAEIRRAFAELK